MARARKKEAGAKSELEGWLDDVAAYELAFKKWEARVEKLTQRYREEPRTGQREWTTARFNLLWSNVQTLSAATFSRLPKPDVSRMFRDQDPVARVAALLLERGLEYHIAHYPEYASALAADVLDRFLGGRGTAWVRYEPHFRAVQFSEPVDGDQVTDDVDTPDEELDYECVAVDYVHYRDFGHSVARTWEEVNRVWRRVYMTKEQLEERFGEEWAKAIPLDADPTKDDPAKKYGVEDRRECATIYEGWEKSTRRAVWFSKSVKKFIDEKDDPLGLEDVFPCPRPLYATLTNDSLVPVPDFIMYQDQANELDLLADRIDGLVKALKVCGGYDASVPELGRIFTEGENGTLVPVKNWAAFAEKNGLAGALSLVDLKPIAEALRAAYEAFEQVRGQVYEITGLSDIIRGQTQASETATAQQIKGQYASLRLRTYQQEVARFASELLDIMGQVICLKFAPDTIAQIGGAEQLQPQDQQYVPQAMALLVGEERIADPEAKAVANPARGFRIEVAADSMVHLDEKAEQEARTEFLTGTGLFLEKVSQSLVNVPPQMAQVLVPLYMEMLEFGVRGFKVGKGIEGAFVSAGEQLKKLAAQPPQPQVPPEMVEQMREQVGQQEKARVAMENATKEVGLNKRAADLDIREMKFQAEQALADQAWQQKNAQAANEAKQREQEFEFSRREGEMAALEREAGAKMQEQKAGFAEERAKAVESGVGQVKEFAGESKAAVENVGAQVVQMGEQLMAAMGELARLLRAPKVAERGPDGKIARVRIEV